MFQFEPFGAHFGGFSAGPGGWDVNSSEVRVVECPSTIDELLAAPLIRP